jgi:quinohemoprotein ethanol dehydrogenase
MPRLASLLGVVAVLGVMTQGAAPAPRAAAVDQQRLLNADRDPGNWMSHGRTWSEQRFSPLKQINDSNAGRLGLLWYADLNTYRGVVATPLAIDGVLYNVSAWSIVTAS